MLLKTVLPNLCVVHFTVWLQKLDNLQGNQGEIKCSRNVVPHENFKDPRDRKDSKQQCFGTRRCGKRTGKTRNRMTCSEKNDLKRAALTGVL